MEFEKCDCGKIATWCYMPGDAVCCDDCVPRGCSCNDNHVSFQGIPDLSEDGIEGINWIWKVKDKIFCYIDEKGRKYPCCEWDYDENGQEKY